MNDSINKDVDLSDAAIMPNNLSPMLNMRWLSCEDETWIANCEKFDEADNSQVSDRKCQLTDFQLSTGTDIAYVVDEEGIID